MIANAPENERRSSGINNVVGLWGPRMGKTLVVNDKISGETPSCKVSTHTECRQKKKKQYHRVLRAPVRLQICICVCIELGLWPAWHKPGGTTAVMRGPLDSETLSSICNSSNRQ